MKKLLLFLFLSFLFPSSAFAHGGLTHMYIAQETIALLPDAKLRNLLLDNFDAYLVGAYYPDSGYIHGATYGEDSHWDPFIFAFADYIKETYPDAEITNPKLVAFLFGCAVHKESDVISHWTFYNYIAEHDFDGDKDKAHQYGDVGIDLLLNLDQNRWFSAPSKWWIPLKDLLAVYHKMGKDQYTAKEIRWGTSVISVAGFGERLISAPAYTYLRWKMPWTAKNYETWPQGGLNDNEHQTASYLMSIWARLHNKANEQPIIAEHVPVQKTTEITDFAASTLENGAVVINTQDNADGSIELASPSIEKPSLFKNQLSELVSKLFS